MTLPARPTRWIVTLCVAMLLIAQVMGLHRHRHVELAGDAQPHGMELHFEDGGLHPDEVRDEHRHDASEAAVGHAHIDIETKVVEPALAKVFVDSMLPVWLALAFLLLLPRGPGIRPRPAGTPASARRPRYGLGPPSHAPPRNPVAV